MESEVLIARRVFRIGVQQLSRVGDQHYVAIKNRTYYAKHPIPADAVARWHKALSS